MSHSKSKLIFVFSSHPATDVVSEAAFTIANISFGTVFQTQYIIDCGALPHLLSVLTHTHLKILKVTIVWILSNILARSEEQIQVSINLFAPKIFLVPNSK